MIEALLPPDVVVATGRVDGAARLHPDEEALAASMGPERRREFAAGRACARRALTTLGHPAAAVLRGERRAPLWPDGVVGSITHADDWCAAAVGRASRWLGVGIDAEPWEPLSARALARICSERERASLAALAGLPADEWATALFSAKESLYKALFPSTGVFLGFGDAEIELLPDTPDAGRFRARLLGKQAAGLAGRERFEGRFARAGDLVWTGLAIEAGGGSDPGRR